MKTLTKTIAFSIVATALTAGYTLAADEHVHEPMPFSAFDTDKDGAISEKELMDTRAKFEEKGDALHKVAETPTFADVDLNKDGKISKPEFSVAQATHHEKGGQGIGWTWK